MVPRRQFRRDRKRDDGYSHNREYRLNNSSIDPAEFRFFDANGRSGARFVGLTRDNNNNNAPFSPSPPSPPRLSSRALVQFSHFLRSLAALSRQSWLCAMIVRSLSIVRVPRWPIRLQTIRAYAHPVYRDRRKRRQESLPFSLSCPLFIPAFLLDNERPGYRKERMAYGCQKQLPRLISPAILPRIAISETTVNFGDFYSAKVISSRDCQIIFWTDL